MKTAEFCPKCYYPLESSEDDGRLCEVCGWFGDKSEICTDPPKSDDLELAFSQLLAFYRDICRMEQIAEQLAEGRADYTVNLKIIRARADHARHSILYLFQVIKSKDDDEKEPA